MKLIKLTKGKSAIVDDEDFEILNKHKWYLSHYGYAVRTKNRKMIWMHREILNTPGGLKTDHIDGNTLDNRKSNLRICLQAENVLNRKAHKGYKGVSWHTQNNKWRARIMINKKEIALGCFETELEAALVYNNAVEKYHGVFGRANSI